MTRRRPDRDPIVAMHRAALDKLANMTPDEVMDVAVRAGIYTKDGKLTPPYRTPGRQRRRRASLRRPIVAG